MRYRDLPRFLLRRIDPVAGEVNVFLAVIAIALLMLDLLYAGHELAPDAARLPVAENRARTPR